MLVAALYYLGKTEEIKAFIGDKINNEDMFGMVLWFYASMELENGNTERPKNYSSEVEIMVLEGNGYFQC
jgi:hypothetical protein